MSEVVTGSGSLRAGVVGVGYLGALHAEKYAAVGGVELTAVYDTDPARASEIAKQHGCVACTSLTQLLASVG